MDRMGMLGESIEHVFDREASRRQPSLQLVGGPSRRTIGLLELQQQGVRVVGRAIGADNRRVTFDDDLLATTSAADIKLAGLLQRIDRFIEKHSLTSEVGPEEPFEPSWLAFRGADRRVSIDLQADGIRTVLWATGYSRSYDWLQVPVVDGNGEVAHRGGVTASPGLYILGMQFLRRRNSAFIDGVGHDAMDIAEHLVRRRSGHHHDDALDEAIGL
jgi:putative flavoprotein involved in K+ transport